MLRNRPDIVQGWSDLEVIRRWWNVFPLRRDREGNAPEPTDVELQMIIIDPAKLAEIRLRLSSVSWFMRCLAMSFTEYLQLLDWTGRQLRADKRGAIPAGLTPILERLQMSGEGWMQLMGRFSRMFRRAAGRPQSLQREREARGCQVMQGIRHSRAVFL